MDWISEIKENENEALTSLYRLYRNECISWIMKNFHCTYEDGLDIFQHTIVILYDNVITGKLSHLTSDIKTYMMGIIRHKTLEWVRKKNKLNHQFHESFWFEYIKEEEPGVNVDQIESIAWAMDRIGGPCRELLHNYYYLGNKIEEITQKMGYRNTDSTKSQKYKCLKRLQSMVFEHKDKNTGF
ncbi:MAG TPA: sigma-70 family RNA polymerase sigma factor [Saprospiraceae bacterium]|nr:sigma-70 family RNA polymerase sigma factor [Saprospiraceae bacterium]